MDSVVGPSQNFKAPNGNSRQSRNENNSNKTCRCIGFVGSVFKGVTVEVVLFFAMFSEAVRGITQETLLIQKICLLDKQYSSGVCRNIMSDETYKSQLEQVQEAAMPWKTGNSILLVAPTIFMSMMIGAWSDNHGRKLPLLLPLIGGAITHLLLALFSHFPTSMYTITLALIPSSAFGIFIAILLSLSYISDITSHRQRTSRIAYLEGFAFSGYPLGTLLAGFMYKWCGYVPVFCLGAASDFVAILYVLIRLKETRGDATVPLKVKLKDLLHFKIFLDSFRAVMRPQRGTSRCNILLMLLALCCFLLYYGSDSTIGYFYSQVVFDWGNFQYSLYNSVTAVLCAFITLLIVSVLSLYFGVSDISLGAMGAFSGFVNSFIFGFSFTGTVFYVAKFLGFFAYNLPVVIRAFMSKVVSEDDLGKVFSFVSMCESVCPVISALLYPYVYKATISVFPSASFFVAALFMVLCLSCFLYVDLDRRKRLNEEVDRSSLIDEQQAV